MYRMNLKRRVRRAARTRDAGHACVRPSVVARTFVLSISVWLALAGCQQGPAADASVAQSPPAPVIVQTMAPIPMSPASSTIAVAQAPARAPDIESLPLQTAACLAHTGAGVSRSVTVHRWVDAAGITHYSDQPPPQASHDHRLIEVQGLAPIEVQASGYDVNLPDHLQQRAVADALGVQRVLHDALGVGAPAGLILRVVFVRAPEAYARLISDPVLASSAGAYSTAPQTIYVRMQAQDEASFAVLRHEITHALVHESIGNLPTSINEGMAEYFGRYRVGGMGGQIDIGADREAMIGAAPDGNGSGALVDLLARDGANFYAVTGDASSREQRYLRAYSLVALLMRDAEGRAALAAVLAAQHADPCRPVAVESVLDAHYPGGLSALATAWADFMRAPPVAVQAY
jgi:hypothetical protein